MLSKYTSTSLFLFLSDLWGYKAGKELQRSVLENTDLRVFHSIMKQNKIKCCVSKATKNNKQGFTVTFLYLKWSASNQEWMKYTNNHILFNDYQQLHCLLKSSDVY